MSVMKKTLFCMLCVIMVFALAACRDLMRDDFIDGGEDVPDVKEPVKDTQKGSESENTMDVSGEQSQTKEDIDALAEEALEKLSVIPEYPEGYPTLEDAVAQYEKANEAVGWIVGTEMAASDADDNYTARGLKYYRVLPDCYLGAKQAGRNPDADKLIYNKETLEAYLATLIHPDEAKEYVLDITESFDVPRFTENSAGALYVLPYAFPAEGYGEENTYELKKNDDASYTLSVHYTTLDDEDKVDGEHIYNVRYVKVDGRWVFENFRVVKQH